MKLFVVLFVSIPFVEGFVGGGRSSPSQTASLLQPSFITRSVSSTASSPSSQLFLSDVPIKDVNDEEPLTLREKDPIQFLKMQINSMDLNAFINAGVLIAISFTVLNALATVDAGIMRGWTPEEMAVRIPVDNWFSYSAVLEQSPLPTKAITSATVYTIGDMISQGTEGKSIGEIDRPRVIRSLLAGLLGHGPLSHLWYDFSENIFENVMHLQGWTGTIIKVLVDQSTWGPFWNNTYILMLGLMKFNKFDKIFDEMKRTTVPLIISGLKLWPLAHCVTYGLVPVENRLLWVDLVEILWVTILSTAAAESGHEAPVAEDGDLELAEEK